MASMGFNPAPLTNSFISSCIKASLSFIRSRANGHAGTVSRVSDPPADLVIIPHRAIRIAPFFIGEQRSIQDGALLFHQGEQRAQVRRGFIPKLPGMLLRLPSARDFIDFFVQHQGRVGKGVYACFDQVGWIYSCSQACPQTSSPCLPASLVMLLPSAGARLA